MRKHKATETLTLPSMSTTCVLSIVFLVISLALCEKNEQTKSIQDRGLVSLSISHDAIVTESSTFSVNSTTQHAQQATFAFITPWNRKGFDYATKFATKFSYLAPVWFQCKPPRSKYQITGDHELKANAAWINQVKQANKQVKIVPRVELLESSTWQQGDYAEMFTSHRRFAHVDAYVSQLVKLAKRANIDGITLEWGYLPVRQAWPVILKLVSELSEFLRQRQKLLFIAAPGWFVLYFCF